MNIVPYRAKLPDLPLPEKRHGGAFRRVPWERWVSGFSWLVSFLLSV